MERARQFLSTIVLVALLGLMVRGDRLWHWAAGMPSDKNMLFTALAQRDTNAVRRALAVGVDVNHPSLAGVTPLGTAACAGDEPMVAYLVGLGADIDSPGLAGFPPLAFAAMNGYTGTMRMLLRAGADVNGRHHGELPVTPPLVCAIISQQNDAAELLIRAGADPNLCGRAGNKCSPLTASVEPEHLDPHLIDLLISAGANANRADANGLTPLDAAMRSGNAASAAALRAAGGIRSCRPKPSRSGHPS